MNAKDNTGQTALHWAAVRGSIAAADVLLQNGARVEADDLNGYRVMQNFISKNIIIGSYLADGGDLVMNMIMRLLIVLLLLI